jgi:protein ImuB
MTHHTITQQQRTDQNGLASGQPPLWLYLYFPTLQLDLLCHFATDSADQDETRAAVRLANHIPLVLVNAQHQVVQANQPAQRAGIQQGMPLAQACALAANLQVRAWQASQEQQQLQQIAEQLYELTADIALAMPTALWIRLDPMLQLYKTLPALLKKLYQPLDVLQLRYQAGLAPTAAAARLFALSSPQIQLTDPEQLPNTLAPLPIKLLPVPAQLVQQLSRLGIEYLGQWLNLPSAELATRFPRQLARLKEELLGGTIPVLQFIQPAKGFERSLELLWYTDQQQQLLAPLQLLLRQLQQYLQKADQRCHRTRLVLKIPDGDDVILHIAPPRALQLQQHWFALWQQKLSTVQLSGHVTRLTLHASDFCQQPAAGPDLLAQYGTDTDPYQLLALLQARLGPEKVRQPGFCASWLPDQANHPSSSAVYQMDRAERKPAALTLPPVLRVAQHAPRPAFLYAEPQPLAPSKHNAKSLDGGKSFDLAETCAALQLQKGTERVSGQWWLDNNKTVDYRIGYSLTGQWLWLCREAGKQWQLQGLFA